MKKILLFLLSAITLVLNIDAQPFNPDEVLTPDKNITLEKLPNGLTYYIRPNGYPEDEIQLLLVVRSGSMMENDDQQGLAHFFEHIAFKGTAKYPDKSITDFLEKNGTKFGYDLNAYTTYDKTVFMIKIASGKPELLEKSIEILSQWADAVSLGENDIEKERKVIIEEWRRMQSGQERLDNFAARKIMEGSIFEKRTPIGKVEVLESFTRDRLVSYYSDWYSPDRMAVIAVGNFDVNDVKKCISKYFSSLVNKKPPREIDMTIPVTKGSNVGILSDPEAEENKFQMYIKKPFHLDTTASDYKETIIKGLFCNMLSDRLDQIRREKNPPFMTASATYSHLFESVNFYNISVLLKDGAVKEGIERAIGELARVNQYGFSEGELKRAKAEFMSFIEKLYNEKDKTHSANLAFEYARNFTDEEYIPGIDKEYQLYSQCIPEITLDMVNRVAEQFMSVDGRVLLLTGKNECTDGIDENKLRNLVDTTLYAKQEKYKEISFEDNLTPNILPAGTVSAVKKDKKNGITAFKLSNGAKVIAMATDYKNDEILISAISHGGSSLVSDSRWASSEVSCAVIGNCGLGKFSNVELKQVLKGKNASVKPFIDTYSEGFTGSSSKKDIETAFQLLYLYFTEPRFDQEAYNSYIERLENAIKNQENSPDAAFVKAFKSLITQNHPRGRYMDMEVFKEINFKDACSIFRERFADPCDFIFIFAGSLDTDQIRELSEKYIASIPSSGTVEEWQDVGLRMPKGRQQAKVCKGSDFKSQVMTMMHGRYHSSLKSELYLDALAYILDMRLMEVVRESLGGTYSINAYPSSASVPTEEYMINIYYGCSPLRVDELNRAVTAEIENLKKEIPQEYLDKLKAARLEDHKKRLKDNSWYISCLTACAFNGKSFKLKDKYTRNLERLTVKKLQRKAKKYFNTEDMLSVVLYPEE